MGGLGISGGVGVFEGAEYDGENSFSINEPSDVIVTQGVNVLLFVYSKCM